MSKNLQTRQCDGLPTKLARLGQVETWRQSWISYRESLAPYVGIIVVFTVALLALLLLVPGVSAQSAIDVSGLTIPGDEIAATGVNFFNAFNTVLILIAGLAVGSFIFRTVVDALR